MGHTTHGLALLPGYLDELAAGAHEQGRRARGRPRHRPLPDLGRPPPARRLAHRACHRHRRTARPAVRHRHRRHPAQPPHRLPRRLPDPRHRSGPDDPARQLGPVGRSVAPYGGTTPVFTPDPIAVGIPTAGDPILIDTSASITTNGMSARLRDEGRRFPHAWLLDAAGNPTDDPSVLFAEPAGTIQPTRRPRSRPQGLCAGPDGRSR